MNDSVHPGCLVRDWNAVETKKWVANDDRRVMAQAEIGSLGHYLHDSCRNCSTYFALLKCSDMRMMKNHRLLHKTDRLLLWWAKGSPDRSSSCGSNAQGLTEKTPQPSAPRAFSFRLHSPQLSPVQLTRLPKQPFTAPRQPALLLPEPLHQHKNCCSL